MSNKGKTAIIIILSIVLVIGIVFAAVPTAQKRILESPTEQTQEETEVPMESADPVQETTELEEVPSENKKDAEELPVTESATQPEKDKNNTEKDTEPQKESEPALLEELSPTDDETEPALKEPISIPGDGEWGGGEFED